MRNTLGNALSRSLFPAMVVALGLAAAGLWLHPDPEPPASDTDARIAYYKQRLGGRGTYPLHARLGLAYLQKARETGQSHWYRDAEHSFRVSQDYQPNFEALLGLGLVHAARHEFAAARAYAEEALAATPSSVEAQGVLFEIALAVGDVASATVALEKLQAVSPGFSTLSREAALREYQGDLAGALDAISRGCRDAEQSGQPPSVRAWCQVRRGALSLTATCDASSAEQAYQEALRILPNFYFAREHIGELRAADGKLTEAAALYEALLRDVPGPGYRLALADLRELEGQADAAQALRQEANDEFWRQEEQGSHEHVAQHAVLLAEITSGVADARKMVDAEWESRKDTILAAARARVYLASGMQKEAEQAIAEALASGTRNIGVYLTAAEIYLEGGNRAEALKLINHATACRTALTPGDQLLARKLRSALPQ